MLISKIRKYSWVAVALISLCLIGFLVQDATNSNTGMFSKNKIPDYGNIAGKEITQQEFAERRGRSVLEYLTFNNQVIAYEQGQYQIDPKTQFEIGEQSWNDFVNEKIIEDQLEKLGLTITDDEFSNLIYGPDPHPAIKNYYMRYSQTGQYDPSILPEIVKQVSDPEVQKNDPQARQEYYQFIAREKYAKRDYMQNKYMSLFSKATYVPEWMAKHNYEVANTRANFAFVNLPYEQIADSTITVSESELKEYYNENKNKYKQTEGRVLEYVTWEFLPTSADSANTLMLLNQSVEKMKAAKDDSIYMATRSEDEERFGRSNYSRSDLYAKGVDSSIVDSFFAKPVGSLVGPFFNAGYYKVAKIKKRENMPDSVDARHILIAVTQDRDSVTAKNLADSLYGLIKGGTDFAQLAVQYSDDQGSQTKGGELGWLTPAVDYVPQFQNYIFKTGKEGNIEIIKTDVGYHIIEIKEIKNNKDFVKVAYLSKKIVPGKETIDSLEKLSGRFYEKYQNPESFEQGVTENRMMKKVTQPLTKNLYEITGLPETREIVLWAFNAEKNEFKYFNMSNRIVIAYVKDVKVNGIAELENVKEQVEIEVIKQKKAEILKKKFDDNMKGATDLLSVSRAMNIKIDSVPNATRANGYAQVIGLEPKVIGTVFGLGSGKMSKTIDGNRGVYITQSLEIIPAVETQDYTLNKNQLTYSLQNKFQGQGMLLELKEKAKVEDNRYFFGD
ncbi:MAG: peptidylprolyl isomerase [Chitinophagales bacterium]